VPVAGVEPGEQRIEAPGAVERLGALARLPLTGLVVAAAVVPFLGFVSSNQDQAFDRWAVARYALLAGLLALGVLVAAALVWRRSNLRQVVVATAVGVLAFFSYPTWRSVWGLVGIELAGPVVVRLAVWALVVAGLVRLAFLAGRHAAVRQWLVVSLLAIGAVHVATVAFAGGSGDDAPTVRAEPLVAASPDGLEDAPNVYLFLLDAYARRDVLRELFAYDDGGFLGRLEDRGFVVDEEALASFPLTFLSTMALFEMGHPGDVEAGLGPDVQSWERFIRGDNATVARFADYGYTFVHSPPGPYAFARCDADVADVCIEADASRGSMGDLELALVGLTPVGDAGMFTPPRTDVTYVLDELEAADPDRPFFLFAHVLSPHWPYVYDEDCELRDSPASHEAMSDEEVAAAYGQDVRCIGADLEAGIDRILADDPTAVIVVASDHGSEVLSDWSGPDGASPGLDEWSDRQLLERFGVLSAVLVPPGCRDDAAGGDLHAVNVFRVVFACLEQRPVDRIDHRAFLWRYDDEELLEVPPERLEGSIADAS
jgi:hypothetical protein